MTADLQISWSDRKNLYWESEGREKASNQLVGTSWFVLVCQVVFLALDRWVFPDQFAFFLSMRMAVNLGVVGILLRWRHLRPEICQIAIPIAVALEILAMIYACNDSDSLYFAGLIIVLVGIPVLQPISPRESIFVSSICIAGFVSLAALTPESVDQKVFVIEVVFILAAAFESGVSCRALEVNRIVQFEQRREIERTRDKLASLDEAKTRFSANIHHELRTPLTLILAPLETLLGGEAGDLSESARRQLKTMHSNGQRLLRLINDLLDLAKLESQRFSIRRRYTDIHSILGNILESVGPLAERKKISLVSNSLPGRCFVFADGDAIERITINLISNALKFTPPGGTISIKTTPSESEGGLTLTVSDTGIGIAPNNLDRIFDRFAQVDESATRENEGTGIGLSLVKELVELHGGRIRASSDGLGHGTTIEVYLPEGELDDQHSDSPEHTKSFEIHTVASRMVDESGERKPIVTNGFSDASSRIQHSIERWESRETFCPPAIAIDGDADKPAIVVADDNAEMREFIRFVLEREFSVHVAHNGRFALELTKDLKPDLVVTDIMMPEMTGIELCEAIKADPAISSTPVMLVSSKADAMMRIEGLESGADDYVTKPFHPKELFARSKGLVNLRILQRKLEERNNSLESALLDLKEAEVQLVRSERLAAVGELAAGIAHEINNPVNFALNAVRALREEIADLVEAIEYRKDSTSRNPPDLSHERLGVQDQPSRLGISETASAVNELGRIISDGLERTHELVSDLRDFASPHRGDLVEVDIAKGIRSTIALLRPTIKDAGVDIAVSLPDRLPSVSGDPGALNQVIVNLLKNALEASRGTGGLVHIGAEIHRDELLVRITDSGPGLEPDAIEKLFEPFYTTKEPGRGTGLGLSISRRIAESHNGQISVSSRPGEGSEFTLHLPLPC